MFITVYLLCEFCIPPVLFFQTYIALRDEVEPVEYPESLVTFSNVFGNIAGVFVWDIFSATQCLLNIQNN